MTDAAGAARRALVVTVVHRPGDARIAHRQLGALRAAGWDVTYAAPFTATGSTPPDWVRAVELPRAVGRDRLGAVRAARAVLRTESAAHDVVLLHDPELLLAVAGLPARNVVWDVHEDPAAALSDRAWVPRWLVPLLRIAVRGVERWAERRCARLLLAETGYQDRFRRRHPVVPNVPLVPDEVPPPDDPRVVYVGRLSTSRGALELLELGRRLRGTAIVELFGYVDSDVEEKVRAADAAGDVRWHGFTPNDEALERIRGAAAGLSLLRDEPNFRHSLPTKVVEYLANGVPVITTPLPEAVRVLEQAGNGTVAPFEDVDAVETAVRLLLADDEGRRAQAAGGHAASRRLRTWEVEGPRFVAELEAVAAGQREG